MSGENNLKTFPPTLLGKKSYKAASVPRMISISA